MPCRSAQYVQGLTLNQTTDVGSARLALGLCECGQGGESSPKRKKTAPSAAAAVKAAAPTPKPVDAPQANGGKARGPATLSRRYSSGSMGPANTGIAAAGGKGQAQDKTIEGMIALAKNWEPGNKKHDPKGMIMR